MRHVTAVRGKGPTAEVKPSKERPMDELSKRHQKLLADAADCDLVANLSEGPAHYALYGEVLLKVVRLTGSAIVSQSPTNTWC